MKTTSFMLLPAGYSFMAENVLNCGVKVFFFFFCSNLSMAQLTCCATSNNYFPLSAKCFIKANRQKRAQYNFKHTHTLIFWGSQTPSPLPRPLTTTINNSQHHTGQTPVLCLHSRRTMLNDGREKIDAHVSPERSRLEPGCSRVTVRSCQGSRVGVVVASRQQLNSIKDELVDNGDAGV